MPNNAPSGICQRTCGPSAGQFVLIFSGVVPSWLGPRYSGPLGGSEGQRCEQRRQGADQPGEVVQSHQHGSFQSIRECSHGAAITTLRFTAMPGKG